MGLSVLGIFHTVIGVVAIIAAVVAFIKRGRIALDRPAGKIYFYFTLITSLTALGLSSVKGLNPGHILAVFVVVLIGVAYFLYAKKPGNNRLRYIETFFLSFSFFLSMIPTVSETFRRIPVGHPLANSPQDPIIGKTILGLLVLFVVGVVLQVRRQWRVNRVATIG